MLFLISRWLGLATKNVWAAEAALSIFPNYTEGGEESLNLQNKGQGYSDLSRCCECDILLDWFDLKSLWLLILPYSRWLAGSCKGCVFQIHTRCLKILGAEQQEKHFDPCRTSHTRPATASILAPPGPHSARNCIHSSTPRSQRLTSALSTHIHAVNRTSHGN